MASSALGLLASNYDDSDVDDAAPAPAPATRALVVNTAPVVMDDRPRGHELAAWDAIGRAKDDKVRGQKVLYQNPEYDALWAPEQGSSLDAAEQRSAGVKAKSHFAGGVEKYHPSSNFAFEEQYHTFNAYGFAADPSNSGRQSYQAEGAGPSLAAANAIVGDFDKWAEARGGSVFSNKAPLESKMEEQRKRLRLDESYNQIPSAQPELTKEQAEAIAAKHKAEKREREGRPELVAEDAMTEQSVFHGSDMRDYQGRSWVTPPADIREEEHECFIPKRWVHTWSGHTKGVAAIRWFPGNGHLLLSAGMDTKVKIWDVFNTKKCMRTYMGHAQAVRDICFTNDGRRFVTCSYDRYLKLWDTETGECISAFTNKKVRRPRDRSAQPSDLTRVGGVTPARSNPRKRAPWDGCNGCNGCNSIRGRNHPITANHPITPWNGAAGTSRPPVAGRAAARAWRGLPHARAR